MSIIMHDRRNTPRMLCADLVRIRWKDAFGKSHKCVANLEDISVNGACIQMETEVAPETVIKITHQRGELVGTVRYCQYREIGYFLGIQFEEGGRWSMENFRPQHLLDPRRLVKRKRDDKPKGTEAMRLLPSTIFVV